MEINIDTCRTKAVFKVAIQSGFVFMRVDRSNYQNEKRHVVIVDAKRFLRLWRNGQRNEEVKLACGGPKQWRADRKFEEATAGFSYGINNPVPLAEAYYYAWPVFHSACYKLGIENFPKFWPKKPSVSLLNGITRTIWLLANGAREFPIECHYPEDAKMLFQLAGAKDTQLQSVSDLLGLNWEE